MQERIGSFDAEGSILTKPITCEIFFYHKPILPVVVLPDCVEGISHMRTLEQLKGLKQPCKRTVRIPLVHRQLVDQEMSNM
ncbi:hypothetical protein LSTR_LSTR014345 [Laodelphax striatellus]|uniref:Uncharacterized protein n=1 Tax=Laodelphax striatellus TaxID=195883 RepID=A0A482WVP3_LAOST|nr:hypothetical protein LSTR_LSTR014345 [Laodelphax striatellus]